MGSEMCIRDSHKSGEQSKAKVLAKKLLVFNDHELVDFNYENRMYLLNISLAHWVLGDEDKAWQTLNEYETAEPDYEDEVGYLDTLAYLDVDKATQLFVSNMKRVPNWNGFDESPPYSLISNPTFYTQPVVRDFYIKQDKWVNFLSKHISGFED